MLQTFDRSVPLSTQRYLVAIKKSCRNHAKRHSTAPERVAKAKANRGAAMAGRIKQAQKSKSIKAWSRWHYSGAWL